MKHLLNLLWSHIQEEPVATQTLVQAIMTCITTFGLRLSVEQTGAILLVTAALLGWLTRHNVTPNVKLGP